MRRSKKTAKLRVTVQWRGKCFHLMTSSWLEKITKSHLSTVYNIPIFMKQRKCCSPLIVYCVEIHIIPVEKTIVFLFIFIDHCYHMKESKVLKHHGSYNPLTWTRVSRYTLCYIWNIWYFRWEIFIAMHFFGFCVVTFTLSTPHDDVIKWKHFPRYWPFVRGIHRPPVNSPHKGQWRGALKFSFICSWINCWVNNYEAGVLRRHRVR